MQAGSLSHYVLEDFACSPLTWLLSVPATAAHKLR